MSMPIRIPAKGKMTPSVMLNRGYNEAYECTKQYVTHKLASVRLTINQDKTLSQLLLPTASKNKEKLNSQYENYTSGRND
jgi:hypothetical protein